MTYDWEPADVQYPTFQFAAWERGENGNRVVVERLPGPGSDEYQAILVSSNDDRTEPLKTITRDGSLEPVREEAESWVNNR